MSSKDNTVTTGLSTLFTALGLFLLYVGYEALREGHYLLGVRVLLLGAAVTGLSALVLFAVLFRSREHTGAASSSNPLEQIFVEDSGRATESAALEAAVLPVGRSPDANPPAPTEPMEEKSRSHLGGRFNARESRNTESRVGVPVDLKSASSILPDRIFYHEGQAYMDVSDYGTVSMPPSDEAAATLLSLTEGEKLELNEVFNALQSRQDSIWGASGTLLHPKARSALWGSAFAKISDYYHARGRNDRAFFFMQAAWNISKYPVFAFNTALLSFRYSERFSTDHE